MKLPDDAPVLVEMSLLGINSRGFCLFFVLASIAAAIGLTYYFQDWFFSVFLIAAALYYYAMRWVDKNCGWDWKPGDQD